VLGPLRLVLELDYQTDAVLACRTLQGQTTFIGNLDPVGLLTFGTTAQMQLNPSNGASAIKCC
jgi:hypothetical protein